MTDPRPCPRRSCPGTLTPTEQGALNGVNVTYWDCNAPNCTQTIREAEPTHTEPALNLEQPP